MSWATQYDSEHGVVRTVYTGIVLPDELFEAAGETVDLAKSRGTRLVLTDCTKLEGGHSVVDLYRLADWVSSQKFTRPFREAVVLSPLAFSDASVRFWETTCVNRGLQVKLFDRGEAALDWLTGATRED